MIKWPANFDDVDDRFFLSSYLDSVKPDDTGDMERAIIQCLLSDSSCIKETTILLPDMFADKMNREIFVAITEIAETSSPVNVSTISANIRQHNIDIEEKELTEYLNKLSPIGTANITFYVRVLRYLYLQTQFYDIMSLAPLVLGEKANITNFFDIVKPALMPLNRALFDTYDQSFRPHWITNGTTTYRVLKSKFDSGGYVWVNNVAVKEVDLLACGYERIFKDSDSPIR